MYKKFPMNWKEDKTSAKNEIMIMLDSKGKEIYGNSSFRKKASDNATFEQLNEAVKKIILKLKKQGIEYRITIRKDYTPISQKNSRLFADN